MLGYVKQHESMSFFKIETNKHRDWILPNIGRNTCVNAKQLIWGEDYAIHNAIFSPHCVKVSNP